jgi:hypothetical protein
MYLIFEITKKKPTFLCSPIRRVSRGFIYITDEAKKLWFIEATRPENITQEV